MQKDSNPLILSRRSALTLAGACLFPWDGLYAAEFWDKKDPSQWTGEEIDRLTTKSPWAKSVTAQYAPGQNPGYGQQGQGYPGGGYPGGGMPRIGIGGIGMGYPRGRGGGGRPGGGETQSNYKGTVRWESAQPIRDALKDPLPDAFAKHFVIAIRDIPLIETQRQQQTQNTGSGGGDQPTLKRADGSGGDNSGNNGGNYPDSNYPNNNNYPNNTNYPSNPPNNSPPGTLSKQTMDDLKQLTTLDPKGKEGANPEIVQQMTPGGTYFLFGFSKIFLDITKKDHEVEFTTHLGRLIVKAKFDPSEMLYHGQLAL